MTNEILTPDDYDFKPRWDIDFDIYCSYSNLSDEQIDLYAAKIRTALTKDGNFAHVEIDGDGTLIVIWADSDTADLDTFFDILNELSSLGAIVEKMPKDVDYDDEMEAYAPISQTVSATPETSFEDSGNTRIKTVYKKAVVYFRADIEYTNNENFQEKLDNFESELCLDLDNLHSSNFDYEFSYDGVWNISEDDIPDWFFD